MTPLPVNQARTLTLFGPCPCKKNLWKSKRGGGRYIDATTKAEIDALTYQAMSQWRNLPPAISPNMEIEFYVRDAKPDRDNKLTALLDCLREAKVIKNDNVKNFNGIMTIMPAVISKREYVVVKIG